MSQKKRILIADDDPAILDSLELILEDAGYEVITTGDGATIQDLVQMKPDLLLLDIWLSGWNGKDICATLKHNEQTKHLPVILFSASRETEAIARDAGADAFITKPFELDDLLDTLEQYL
uniref:Response regulatory domain-containing protein n=1 Tax=Thermosporothrix sp. COM3 TaxID=2490863 RepID=A0A455SHU6_9CHLR|nr:hypothetical protein KTC_12500 [Thermosporothrix sp. COM3]